jgi:glycosyltransferase involved in cell wall biosynthesis
MTEKLGRVGVVGHEIAVVIPAYNEAGSILKVVEGVRGLGYDVIVVDDGSEDGTKKEAERAGATVLRHVVNVGVGLATVTGNDYAVKKGYKIIVNIDADEQHFPQDIPRALKYLVDNNLDIVFGSRFLDDTSKFPWVLMLGNKSLTLVNRLLFGSSLTDSQTGFRVVRAEVWRDLGITSPGYSICSEIAAKAGRKYRFGEIPVRTVFLDKFKGTTILDGLKIFYDMLKWRFRR